VRSDKSNRKEGAPTSEDHREPLQDYTAAGST